MDRNREGLFEADYKVHYDAKVVSDGFKSGEINHHFAVCSTFTECTEFHRTLEIEPVYKVGRITKMIILKSIWYEGPDGKPIKTPKKRKPVLRVSYDVAKQYLSYNPDTGELLWKMGSRRGKSAVRIDVAGRPHVRLMGADRSAARLAWTLHHKAEPTNNIRNISKDKTDLRIINLREI